MSKEQPPSRVAEQFVVRFPEGMRDRIAEAAKANNRSMNSEIVARLENSFHGVHFQAPMFTMSAQGGPYERTPGFMMWELDRDIRQNVVRLEALKAHRTALQIHSELLGRRRDEVSWAAKPDEMAVAKARAAHSEALESLNVMDAQIAELQKNLVWLQHKFESAPAEYKSAFQHGDGSILTTPTTDSGVDHPDKAVRKRGPRP